MRDAEGTRVAEFLDPWEAQLARHFLTDAGIEAWLEDPGPERGLTGGGTGRIRLVVSETMADDARGLLAEMEQPAARGRPAWVPLVAGLVAAGLIWTAVPRFLWPWVLLTVFVGFLLWRAVGPRRP